MKTPIKTKTFESKFTIPSILCLCRGNLKLFKKDVRELQSIQTIEIEQSLQCQDLNSLCKKLENHIYALWIASSLKGNAEEWIFVDVQEVVEFLRQGSNQNKVIGLSLLDHCLRSEDWTALESVLKNLSSMESIEPSHKIKDLLNASARILTDHRVLQLFSDVGIGFNKLLGIQPML